VHITKALAELWYSVDVLDKRHKGNASQLVFRITPLTHVFLALPLSQGKTLAHSAL
jgi:hypothetical protein